MLSLFGLLMTTLKAKSFRLGFRSPIFGNRWGNKNLLRLGQYLGENLRKSENFDSNFIQA